jgi:hypothetical protein
VLVETTAQARRHRHVHQSLGRPHPNWTETIQDLLFTSATIRVFQAGALVLTVDCNLHPADLEQPGARRTRELQQS